MCVESTGPIAMTQNKFQTCLLSLVWLATFVFVTSGGELVARTQAVAEKQAAGEAKQATKESAVQEEVDKKEKSDDSDDILDLIREQSAEKDGEPKIPKGVDVYMGRRVAKTMHYLGAEWLIRNTRERQERCSLMLANLGLKPGMTVCDMGCGNGFYSLPIAKMLGNHGLVVGVDVQPEMLGFLRERAEKEGIDNIVPILGSYHHPRLPPGTIDLVLMVDVYHEFSHPEQMLAAIRKSLKPDGLVVLVEYREEDPKVPIKPLHKMSKAQVNKELAANGFKLAKEFDNLPWQHMMFFGIDGEKDLEEKAMEEKETGSAKESESQPDSNNNK